MTTQTSLVQPGAIFTYQSSDMDAILVAEVHLVVQADGWDEKYEKDDVAYCTETLSHSARRTPAEYLVGALTDGAFTYAGNVRPEAEQRLYAPREGDLFLYRIDPSYDWPTAEFFVAEVVHLEQDGSIVTLVTSGEDDREYLEIWTPTEVVARFAYAGHVGTDRER